MNQPVHWFLFQGNRLLVNLAESRATVPLIHNPEEIGLFPVRQLYLGYWEDDGMISYYFCGEIARDTEPPNGYSWEPLRSLYLMFDEKLFWLAGMAFQILDWDRSHQFCGRCGHATTNHEEERAKVCPNCGLVSYPRLDPAIIVRIQRQAANGPEILLARSKRFTNSMFSVLAGFVEPGESLEECVMREVYEEVGITIRNIQYFGSQPWPFPHSLMIAFTADYEGGLMKADHVELSEAGWFQPDALPNIPTPPSIAYKLISTWQRTATSNTT